MTSVRTWSRRAAILTAAAVLPAASVLVGAPATPAPAAGKDSKKTCDAAQTGWRAPVQQHYRITSGFGKRTDPINHQKGTHGGVDLAITSGPGPVVAAQAGTVVRAGKSGGLGNAVTLRHPSGVQTRYGHMAHIDSAIKSGTKVEPGQKLGVEGSTGHSTGKHVHFEVHRHGKRVDPVPFMKHHSAALNGRASTTASSSGFSLPPAKKPRKHSRKQKPLPVPEKVMDLYVAAGQKYHVPWPLLAGVGMAETAHGRVDERSSAGARGPMQFLPSTFAQYGVDGNDDGQTDIDNTADSIYSAAHALHELGVKDGAAGVRKALFGYNHAEWYVNDVLYYAAAYSTSSHGHPCSSSANDATNTPDTTKQRESNAAVRWARSRTRDTYRFGADGPHAWDSSSFVQAAYAKAGIKMPRTAQAQRNWLASGHGTRVEPGQEKPGDLIFEDSYLGKNKIGFVQLVDDAESQRSVAARNRKLGISTANYSKSVRHKHIFEIWRVR